MNMDLSTSPAGTNEAPKRKSKKARFAAYLEGLLDEADAARFPVINNPRHCEQWNQFAHTLNARHAAGDRIGIEEVKANIMRVLCSLDDEN